MKYISKYKKKNISFYKLEGLTGHDRVLSSNKYEWIEYPNYDSVSTATSKMKSILEIDNWFFLNYYYKYVKLLMYLYGLLVKRLNTLPSQGNIHGFEFRTGYQVN